MDWILVVIVLKRLCVSDNGVMANFQVTDINEKDETFYGMLKNTNSERSVLLKVACISSERSCYSYSMCKEEKKLYSCKR